MKQTGRLSVTNFANDYAVISAHCHECEKLLKLFITARVQTMLLLLLL